MTKSNITSRNYKPDYSTCGSKIYNYDFDGYVSITDMAERIISDLKFDEKCRKKLANKNKQHPTLFKTIVNCVELIIKSAIKLFI